MQHSAISKALSYLILIWLRRKFIHDRLLDLNRFNFNKEEDNDKFNKHTSASGHETIVGILFKTFAAASVIFIVFFVCFIIWKIQKENGWDTGLEVQVAVPVHGTDANSHFEIYIQTYSPLNSFTTSAGSALLFKRPYNFLCTYLSSRNNMISFLRNCETWWLKKKLNLQPYQRRGRPLIVRRGYQQHQEGQSSADKIHWAVIVHMKVSYWVWMRCNCSKYKLVIEHALTRSEMRQT